MIDDGCPPVADRRIGSGEKFESLFPVVLSMSAEAGASINFCELYLE